jgi:hypothetical protein
MPLAAANFLKDSQLHATKYTVASAPQMFTRQTIPLLQNYLGCTMRFIYALAWSE